MTEFTLILKIYILQFLKYLEIHEKIISKSQ